MLSTIRNPSSGDSAPRRHAHSYTQCLAQGLAVLGNHQAETSGLLDTNVFKHWMEGGCEIGEQVGGTAQCCYLFVYNATDPRVPVAEIMPSLLPSTSWLGN